MPAVLRRTIAVTQRVLGQLRRDHRFLALSLVAPLAIIYLLKMFIDTMELTTTEARPPIEQVLAFLNDPNLPPGARELAMQKLEPLFNPPKSDRFAPTQFAVPLGAFFIHFFTYLLCALVLVRERTAQTLGRMFVSGFRQFDIIGGYVLAYSGLATLQSLLVLTELSVLFKLDYGLATLLSIYLVIWLLAIISIALGIFVSNFARTEGQVFPFIPLVVLPSVFLSGVIISVDNLPRWAQILSYVVPLHCANEVLQHLIQPGGTLSDAWGSLVALSLYGAGILLFATRTLRELD
jgi:ABC-2 type transport system permease protein